MTESNWRHYFKRPDRAFWLDLLSPAPDSTVSDMQRRARLARYALGAALVFTAPYIVLSLLVAPIETRHVIFLNMAGMAGYGFGMWCAALGADRAARMWLMATLSAQVLLLVWLTGAALGVWVFVFVTGALTRVLFATHEKALRLTFLLLSALTLVASFVMNGESYVDFSVVPAWLLAFAKVANALMAFGSIILLLGVSDREVLRSEAGLVLERDRSERLLHVILPAKIVALLQHDHGMIAHHHPDVTVLFVDIAGFTPWAARHEPEQVVAMLERVFSRFDALVARVGAEKIKTIGDAYMVISGAPESREDHASVMARLALAFMAEIENIRNETGIDLGLRAGLNSGPVIAGVIGTVRFSYDVWGDTVNTASRMESSGEVGRIHVTTETKSRLGNAFELARRGPVDIKGKGVMETWWLVGGKDGDGADQ